MKRPDAAVSPRSEPSQHSLFYLLNRFPRTIKYTNTITFRSIAPVSLKHIENMNLFFPFYLHLIAPLSNRYELKNTSNYVSKQNKIRETMHLSKWYVNRHEAITWPILRTAPRFQIFFLMVQMCPVWASEKDLPCVHQVFFRFREFNSISIRC